MRSLTYSLRQWAAIPRVRKKRIDREDARHILTEPTLSETLIDRKVPQNCRSMHMQTSRWLTVAATLFASELVLGVGLIGVIGGLVGVAVALFSDQQSFLSRRRIQVASAFLCVVLATFGWLALNIRIAKRNAAPIIAACERFRSAHGRYPFGLDELTPNLLPSLAKARYTLVAGEFAYHSDPPELCFAAMFHGVFCYGFQSGTWMTNE